MEAVLNGPFGQIAMGTIPLTIGRTPDNHLVLADPKVSSHHAEIRLHGQDYALVDLGSTNGTFVNEQRLDAQAPRLLHTADIVHIGDTHFTYEVPGMFSIEPTIYAGSRPASEPGYPPPASASSSPVTGYGSSIQPEAYPPPPARAGSEPFVYAPGPLYYGTPPIDYGSGVQSGEYQPPPPPASAGSPYYGGPVSPPAQPRKRGGLWIILGVTGVVLVIGLILLGAIGYVNRSTPTKTMDAFCNAVKSRDFHTAYNQLSSGLQSKFGSEAQFTTGYNSNNGLGEITNCTVSQVNDSAGTGTTSNTFASGSTLIDDYTLVNENGSWKINSQQPRSIPTLTMHTYCSALKSGDYQAAYNQLSTTAQSQESEAQFAANFSPHPPNDCIVSQVNDTIGTGTITYTYSGGTKLIADYTLVNESGTWKIKTEQPRSTPTLTLASYCSALKSGDYQTAYNQLSSSLQGQITEAQLASSFSTDKVTNCRVTNIDDTAGTGTINFTYASGSSKVFDFMLIDENSTWKIQKGQARS